MVNAVVVVEIVVEDVVVVLPLVMMMKIRKHGTASGVAVPVFAGGFAMVSPVCGHNTNFAAAVGARVLGYDVSPNAGGLCVVLGERVVSGPAGSVPSRNLRKNRRAA